MQNVKDYKPGDVKRPLLREMLVWMIKETERGERPLLREMLIWMISEKELKPGGAERPLLREMLVWMISEKELKPGGAERMNIGISGFLTVEVDAPSLQ